MFLFVFVPICYQSTYEVWRLFLDEQAPLLAGRQDWEHVGPGDGHQWLYYIYVYG